MNRRSAVVTLAAAAVALLLAMRGCDERGRDPIHVQPAYEAERQPDRTTLEVPAEAESARTADDTPEPQPVETAEPASRIWSVEVEARWEGGGRASLDDFLVCVSRDRQVGTVLETSARHLYRWGAASFDRRDGEVGVLALCSEPPLHAALVLGDTMLEVQMIDASTRRLTYVMTTERILALRGGFEAVGVDGVTPDRPFEKLSFGYRKLDDPRRPVYQRARDGVEWSNMAPGLYRLHLLSRSPYRRCSTEFEVLPGQITDLGTLELFPTAGIFGEIHDPSGVIVEANVKAWNPELTEVGDFGRENYAPGFAFGDMPTGEAVLAVDDAAWAPVPARLTLTDVEGFTNAVIRAAPGVSVTFAREGLDVGRVDLLVIEASGLPCWGATLERAAERTQALRPGRYTLRVDRGPAFPREELPFDVGDEPVRVAIGPPR